MTLLMFADIVKGFLPKTEGFYIYAIYNEKLIKI